MRKKGVIAARLVMGLIFLVFGFDGIVHFFPLPSMPQEASAFMNMLISSKLFYAVKGFEIISAILLLSGMYVSLALALVAPVLFNIVWFDLMLAPSGLPVGILLTCLEGFLLWDYRESFAPLFKKK